MTQLASITQTVFLSRRIILLLIMVGVVLVMGFYTITDPVRLANDNVLDGADIVGYAICHRITERSFTIGGRQLPLCARCTGMYLGVILTFLVLFLAGRRRWSDLPPLRVLIPAIGLIGLMGIDGINSYSHFFPDLPHVYEPRNWLRLVTGMGTGLTMGIILFPALAQTLWHHQVLKPALGTIRELLGLVLLATIVVALVLSNQPILLYVLGLASAVGVIVILTALNTTALLIVTKRDARADSWRQAALPLFFGLLLAVVQISLISYVRFALTGTLTGFPGI